MTQSWKPQPSRVFGGNDAETHARLIRRAICDAERDGYAVDFDWRVIHGPEVTLRLVRKDGRWKNAVLIWPPGATP